MRELGFTAIVSIGGRPSTIDPSKRFQAEPGPGNEHKGGSLHLRTPSLVS